jgi:hypothetical protein
MQSRGLGQAPTDVESRQSGVFALVGIKPMMGVPGRAKKEKKKKKIHAAARGFGNEQHV